MANTLDTEDNIWFTVGKDNRRRILMIYKNYKFYVGSRNDQKLTTRWQCVHKTCSTKLYTDQHVQLILDKKNKKFLLHNHLPQPLYMIQRKIINVKYKDMEVCQPLSIPRSIVQRELSRCTVARNLGMDKLDVKRMVKLLYDTRNKEVMQGDDDLPGIVYEATSGTCTPCSSPKNG